MKLQASYLAALSALIPLTVFYFDEKIQVTPRVLDGSIVEDVERVHTYSGLTDYVKVKHNMVNLRKHADCATNPKGCKNPSPR